jgi:transposase
VAHHRNHDQRDSRSAGGYDHDMYQRLAGELDIRPLIARRNTGHGSGLGTRRWVVVERTFALLHHFRRLRIRWEIRDDMHEALLRLGCALICWRAARVTTSGIQIRQPHRVILVGMS